jgi:hypothetical protein
MQISSRGLFMPTDNRQLSARHKITDIKTDVKQLSARKGEIYGSKQAKIIFFQNR